MMSPAVRQQFAYDAAQHARRNGYVPIIITQDLKERQALALKDNRPSVIHIPFLGGYVPRGYERTERKELFVDTSGMGNVGEPSLTAEAFLEALTVGKAYAMTEVGQFQAYVAEFTPPASGWSAGGLLNRSRQWRRKE